MFLKVDLKKAYDRVSWSFLRLVFIQIGLKWDAVQWILGCVCNANFAVLINGSPSDFFKSGRVLRQGFPLSPLLFLLVVECLSKMILKAREDGSFTGFKITACQVISHLLFVDNVLILGSSSLGDWTSLKKILDSFCRASGLEINFQKSVFLPTSLEDSAFLQIQNLFGISSASLDEGFKYLGFVLKPNNYRIVDWLWLVQKVEKRI